MNRKHLLKHTPCITNRCAVLDGVKPENLYWVKGPAHETF